MTAVESAQTLRTAFGAVLSGPMEFRGEVTLQLADAARLAEVCAHAKDSLGFDFLTDITAIDNLGEAPRFTLVYELYNMRHGCRLRLKAAVAEEQGEVPTVCGVWRAAEWHEREIYDMMGLRFAGHPDLRRILMWEGYPYFPLRKDFPLAGRPTDVPGVAFTERAPLEGGPFVTAAGGRDTQAREPRVRQSEG